MQLFANWQRRHFAPTLLFLLIPVLNLKLKHLCKKMKHYEFWSSKIDPIGSHGMFNQLTDVIGDKFAFTVWINLNCYELEFIVWIHAFYHVQIEFTSNIKLRNNKIVCENGISLKYTTGQFFFVSDGHIFTLFCPAQPKIKFSTNFKHCLVLCNAV